jgi:hypothetical protein
MASRARPVRFERDRAAFAASVYVGKRTEHLGKTWEVTKYSYTRGTMTGPCGFEGTF